MRVEKLLEKGCGEESTVTAPEEDCPCRNHIKEYLGPDRASSLASYFPLHPSIPSIFLLKNLLLKSTGQLQARW